MQTVQVTTQHGLLPVETINEVPVIDSRIVAKELDISHTSLIKLITNHLITIEANFGKVGFEIVPSGKTSQQLRTAHLTEDQALFIGSLSKNTAKVVVFKVRLVKSFAQARQALVKQITPLSGLQILEMQVSLMKEQDSRIQGVEDKVNLIEAKITTSDQDYFTISGYCRLNKIKINGSQAIGIGKACSRESYNGNVPVGKIKDTRYGQVNTYHIDILNSVVPSFMKGGSHEKAK